MSNALDNVVLIGMPGAGKSTLGVVLAKILGYEFIDADLLIQSKLDKTLQKIIDACGPDGFIEVENEVLCTLSAKRAIIATGGSAVYSDEAMKHLKSIGTVVYLRVSYEELENRLGGLHERGVVMKNGIGMSLHDLYEERLPLYEKYADITLDIDGLSVRDTARKLVDQLSLM
ncbi:MAG: shikimate kinase [Eggerthellaceae bacterium]